MNSANGCISPREQSGVGSIANAAVGGLATGLFEHLTVWTEVFQDNLLDLFDSGKLDYVTACQKKAECVPMLYQA
jgi:acyl-CoA hydrolase